MSAVRIAAMHLEHGHIYGQVEGLLAAGAELVSVYDPDPAKIVAFRQRLPQARVVTTPAAILEDRSIDVVCAAAIPAQRGPLGLQVLAHDKDYFTDKAPFTSLAQLTAARAAVARTGRKYAVYFSERLHSPASVLAGELVASGRIGRVVQVLGLGPHRHGTGRPAWFYQRQHYGGILIDIGSHQLEQFLYYTGNQSAKVVAAQVGNFAHPEQPEFEDFGAVSVVGANGASGYHRVDWLSADGLSTWGDGRLFLLGTEGHIEVRKQCDLAQGGSATGNRVYVVDREREVVLDASNHDCPFFADFLRDVRERSDLAQPQEHAFAAAELCLQAQAQATWLTGEGQPDA